MLGIWDVAAAVGRGEGGICGLPARIIPRPAHPKAWLARLESRPGDIPGPAAGPGALQLAATNGAPGHLRHGLRSKVRIRSAAPKLGRRCIQFSARGGRYKGLCKLERQHNLPMRLESRPLKKKKGAQVHEKRGARPCL